MYRLVYTKNGLCPVYIYVYSYVDNLIHTCGVIYSDDTCASNCSKTNKHKYQFYAEIKVIYTRVVTTYRCIAYHQLPNKSPSKNYMTCIHLISKFFLQYIPIPVIARNDRIFPTPLLKKVNNPTNPYKQVYDTIAIHSTNMFLYLSLAKKCQT